MMKTPFRKLHGPGLHSHDKHDRHAAQRSLAQLDELSQASQDMQDMRDCYESLLSAAAGTTNNAYEFSESLQEMGDCLLEKTAPSDDESIGRVLLMLGKVQFDIQKLLDNYRSHISQTITVPSQSLLNELQIVEEMKKKCDEKRMSYESMKVQYDKGRMKNSKGEHVSSRQLQSARDEFDEHATLFIFRMKSLKRGQSHSLLTQAARHYAAQMCFFRKALKSLEAIEPQVRLTTEQQHIDYHFSGLEDDDGGSIFLAGDEDEEDDGSHYGDSHKDDDLNIDSHKNEISSSGKTKKLDIEDLTFLRVASVNSARENMHTEPLWNSNTLHRDLNTESKSAPLSAETTLDPYERYRQLRKSSARKLSMHVLPTPREKTSGIETQHAQLRQPTDTLHSMPLEYKKDENVFKKEKNSEPVVLSEQSVLKEINHNSTPTKPPAPKTEVCSSIQVDSCSASSIRNIKRDAFSGPLTGVSPMVSVSGPTAQTVDHLPSSGPLLCTLLSRSLSTSGVSSNLFPLPMISELHELPRPPLKMASNKPSKVSFPAPLVTFKHGPDLTDTNGLPVSDVARTLPEPLRCEKDTALTSKQTENWNVRAEVAMVSPPRLPISIRNI